MTGTGEARDAKLEKLRAAMEKVAAEGGEPIIDATRRP